MPVAGIGDAKSGVRKHKQSKRAGVHARLKTNPSRPALPSPALNLNMVCSLDNKMEYIQLPLTWLSDRVPDAAIQLNSLIEFHADRVKHER